MDNETIKINDDNTENSTEKGKLYVNVDDATIKINTDTGDDKGKLYVNLKAGGRTI